MKTNPIDNLSSIREVGHSYLLEEDYSDSVELLESLERMFIKDDEIAFFYKPKLSSVFITPLHRSITNLMNAFGLKLSQAAAGNDTVIETYSDGINKALIVYRVDRTTYNIKDENGFDMDLIRTSFVLDPKIEVYSPKTNKSSFIDLGVIINSYTKNIPNDTIIKIILKAAEDQKKYRKYIR